MTQTLPEQDSFQERSDRIKISYDQLRDMGYLRTAEPRDLPPLDDASCIRTVLEGECGWGTMERWSVFPEMDLIWFDTETPYALTMPEDPATCLEIVYCYEGRCEIRGKSRTFFYAGPGDLAVCESSEVTGLSGFPSDRFQGICLRINMNPQSRDLSGILKNFSIHLPGLYIAAWKTGVLRLSDCARAHHIFTELRDSHDEFRPDFLKLKVIELLLVLSDRETLRGAVPWTGLTSYQTATMKEIRTFMSRHFDEHHTVTELSGQFHFSATSLKQWFRIIYGTSMYAYLKNCRMNIAKALLQHTDHSILQVAMTVGYENPSKFSSAFRDEVGMTPKQYRLTHPALPPILEPAMGE